MDKNLIEYEINKSVDLVNNTSKEKTLDINKMVNELLDSVKSDARLKIKPSVTDNFSHKLNPYIVDNEGNIIPNIDVIHNVSSNECWLYNAVTDSRTQLTTELNSESLRKLDAFIKLYFTNDCIIKHIEATNELYCILNVDKSNIALRKLELALNENDIKYLMQELQ